MAAAALPAPTTIEPAVPRWVRQMRGEADIGVRGRDRCVVERQQRGTRSGLCCDSGHGLRSLSILRLICA